MIDGTVAMPDVLVRTGRERLREKRLGGSYGLLDMTRTACQVGGDGRGECAPSAMCIAGRNPRCGKLHDPGFGRENVDGVRT